VARVSVRGVVATLFTVLLATACVRLGIWQLDRLAERRAANARSAAALALPPVELDAASAAALAQGADSLFGRRVRVRGHYDPAGEVVLRGRAHNGRPGVHIITPLRIPGSGVALLVDRGWVPTSDAASVELAPLREPGEQVVIGTLAPVSTVSAPTMASERDGVRTYLRLDRDELQAALPYPLLPVLAVQLPEAGLPELPLREPLPPPTEGNHFSYAVQWFSFATIAVVGWIVLFLRSRREARAAPAPRADP